MKLTSKAVDDMMCACLFRDDENMDNAIKVEGIIQNYAFHQQRVAENSSHIGDMLNELPTEFQANGGGGWTFLNACNTKDGKQWTGLHQQMERLFVLGIAAGKARWLLSRDMWSALPGGLPYVSVN